MTHILRSLILLLVVAIPCAGQPLTDDDIILPEALTVSIDSLLQQYYARQYLQKDSTSTLSGTSRTYTAEEYQQRLQRLPTIIEMPYNSVVQEHIDRYTGRLRTTVSYLLAAANFYMPIFEEALEAYGLPLELRYLPVIESALNPRAVSRAGATGLWQFMLITGRQYGLEVNSLVDDRQDPIKSSYAAAHYLADLFAIFGDWTLAIAAYNCGPENVNKAIHRAGSTDYWQMYPYLPKETRGYIPAFIAANYIMNYYCEHNICPLRATLPVKVDTLTITRDVHFEQIAQVLAIDVAEIEALNPQYRQHVINGATRPSTLCLPVATTLAFLDNEEEIYAYRAEELLTHRAVTAVAENPRGNNRRSSGTQTVTIRRGDTLSAIAKRYGTTVTRLKQLNPNIKGTTLIAGKKLRVR